MNNKKVIIVLIILLLVIIILKKSIKYYNESFNRNNNKINYFEENRIIFIENKLDNLLKSLSKNNHNYILENSKYNLYIPQTTPSYLRESLRKLSEYVLQLLNKDKLFEFHFSNLGDIKVYSNDEYLKQYNYELFVYDKKNAFSLKFNVNILTYNEQIIIPKYIKQNILDFECRTFDTFFIGTPSKSQYIPDALNVITTGNEVLGDGGIDYPEMKEKILKAVLLNITIGESTLVLHPLKDTSLLNDIYSIEKTVLENGPINYSNYPIYPNAKTYNKWIQLPKTYQKNTLKTPFNWDFLGCQYTENINTQMNGEFWRSNYGIPQNGSKFNWLFNRVNASGAISSSNSQPPP
jgi:hypothetical protein